MKNYIFSLLLAMELSLLINPLLAMDKVADQDCFLVKKLQKGHESKFIVREGPENNQHPPCCTFNIPLAVVAYEKEVLVDSKKPVEPFNEIYPASRPILKQEHNPTNWMAHSCVWYTQLTVKKLGIESLKQGLNTLSYSKDPDFSGYALESNGLPLTFWIADPLKKSPFKVSPREQLDFMEKLANSSLHASQRAQLSTQEILVPETLPCGVTMYGKTGAGNLENGVTCGWYVGYAKIGDIIFTAVRYLEEPGPEYPSPKAKEQVKEKVNQLIQQENEH